MIALLLSVVLAAAEPSSKPAEDSVETRAEELFRLGMEMSNPEALARCVKLAPNGPCAPSAKLHYGMLLTESDNPETRRKGIEVLLEFAFSSSPFAEEALYLAAIQSFRDERYDEAKSLFRRSVRLFPKGVHAEEMRNMAIWCDYKRGHFAEVLTACGAGGTDDLDYLKAACVYSMGDSAAALKLFKQYLSDHPTGAYRADAELPIARIEYETSKDGSTPGLVALERGKREFAAGEYEKADRTLKSAVALNEDNEAARAESFLLLAKTSGAMGDWSTAVTYATIMTSLFHDEKIRAEAEKIIADHPEAK